MKPFDVSDIQRNILVLEKGVNKINGPTTGKKLYRLLRPVNLISRAIFTFAHQVTNFSKKEKREGGRGQGEQCRMINVFIFCLLN